MPNDHGPMTPVPRSFLDSLSNDLSTIKKDTRSTNEAIVELRTDMRATKGRLKKIEDNIPCEAVVEVREDSKQLALKVNTAEAKISAHDADLEQISSSDSKRIYWLLGAAVVIVGAVAGWLTTMATMETNVETLQAEQMKIRDEIKGLSSATYKHTAQVEKASQAVQTAVTEAENSKGSAVPVDMWYRTLSPENKRLLERRGITVPLSPPLGSVSEEAVAPAEDP